MDAFAHDQRQRQLSVEQRHVHESLDPRLVAGPASAHAGQVMRECMITDEHPDPTPIAILFDETGSMGEVPRVLREKLARLHGLLGRRGYVSDPQILFGAIGDANTGWSGGRSEIAPLQVGQFESDNRMDANLESIYLEGNGGGQAHETYELGAYFLARHTFLEPFARHAKKGYAFFIGDERAYPTISRESVKRLIGDDLPEDLSTRQIFEELKERYHVFFIFISQGTYEADFTLGSPSDLESWRGLLGERALQLDDAEAVCECIAGTVGTIEGTSVSVSDVIGDMRGAGVPAQVADAAQRALASLGA
jgi:hypothetical protein